MKKGAVPIPYIIALLLGIAVVAILGYWFFVLGGEWGGEMNLQKCTVRAHTYCSSWQLGNYGNSETEVPTPGWYAIVYPKCAAFASELGFSDGSGSTGHFAGDISACGTVLGA
jgi:hypothetical protein